jgi:hypothetical protein
MKKGIGPRNLGAPKGVGKMYDTKSAAKQVDYKNLKPKDAKTYADSVAVEVGRFSKLGSTMGEVAGKVASGGTLQKDPARGFTTGNTPNSADAKEMMKRNRNLIKKFGGNYKDAYK